MKEMEKMIYLAITLGVYTKMKQADTSNRVELATTVEEKSAVVKETEKFVVDVVDEVLPNELVGEKGAASKKELVAALIDKQYHFFKLPNPYKTEVAPKEEEEFFTN